MPRYPQEFSLTGRTSLVYNNIKEYRLKAKMATPNDGNKNKYSINSMAKALGVNPSTYLYIERTLGSQENKLQPINEFADKIVKYLREALPWIKKSDLFFIRDEK